MARLLGHSNRAPGSPSRSKRVEEALAVSPESVGFNARGKRLKPREKFFVPKGARLLRERCNCLWRLYYHDRLYFMVIGETIRDDTEVRYLAVQEGDKVIDTRASKGKGLHRASQCYGFSTMLIDYLRSRGKTLWVRGVEWPLDHFESFDKISPGAHETQYGVPRNLIDI